MSSRHLAHAAESCRATRAADRATGLRVTSRPWLFREEPGLLLLIIVIADWAQLADPDLWGHIRFGQAVIALGHLVRFDPYSYSAAGAPWRNHEWLSEVIMALLYDNCGVLGLKLWKLGCVGAAILFTAGALEETGATLSLRLDILMIAAVALAPYMEFRPQLFSFAFFAGTLMLLARDSYRGTAPLWLLIPLMALWANLHGGFIAGLAALAVCVLVRLAENVYAHRLERRTVRLVVVVLGATAATLLTPYGIGTWCAVGHALGNPMTRLAVNDWQPLIYALARHTSGDHAALAYYLCALILMAATVLTFVLAPGDLAMAAIAALMIAAAFAAVRNVPLAVMACTVPLARQAAGLTAKRRANARCYPTVSKTRRTAVAPPAAIIVAIVLAAYGGIFSSRIMTDRAYPAGAVSFMKSHRWHGNILCDFGWGEYLIWHLPGSKVFIDGRYDTVYSLKVIRDYLLFYFDLPGGTKVLDSYPHDFLLIPPGSEACRETMQVGGWKLVYRDSDAVLFARADSHAAQISRFPVDGVAAIRQFFP